MPASDILQEINGQAQASAAAGQSVAPAQARQALTAGPQVGVPPVVGMHVAGDIAAQAQHATDRTTLATSPSVASWVASNPAKAAATRDDWGGMASLVQSTQDVVNMFGTPLAQFHMPHASTPGAPVSYGWMAPVVGAQQAIQGVQSQILQSMSPLLRYPTQVVNSLVNQKLGFKGAPTAPLERTGFLLGEALPFAAMPGSVASRVVNAGLPFLGSVAGGAVGKAAGNQDLGEQIGGFLGMAGTMVRFGSRPLVDLGTAHVVGDAEDGMHDMQSTPYASVTGPQLRLSAPGVKPEQTDIYKAAAQGDADAIAKLQEQTGELSFHADMPSLTEDFLGDHTPAGDHSVFVPTQNLIDLAQKGVNVFPGLEHEIAQAHAEGTELELPLSKYLAATSGQTWAKELNDATRFREDGVSKQEVDELPQPALEAEEAAVKPQTAVTIPSDIEPELHEPLRALAASADDSVEEVFKEHGLSQLFGDAKAAGLSKGQFDRYGEAIDSARADLHARLMERTYNQIRRERTPEWKNAVAQHKAGAEQDLAKDRSLAAYSALSRGKGVLGEPLEKGFKLDSKDQLAKYAQDLGLPKTMFSADGKSPDEIAGALGYPSGTDLINDLAATHERLGEDNFATHLKGQVHELATQRAREELGYDISPDGMLDAARDLVQTSPIENLLVKDLADFAEAHDLPFNKDDIKAAAKQVFQTQTVRIAGNPRRFAENMRRLGNKAEAHLMDGKPEEAFVRKQQQLLQYHQMAESFDFQKRLARDNKDWKRIAKKVSMPGVSQDALNWSKDILATLRLPVKGNPKDLSYPINGHNSLGEFIAAKRGQGWEIVNAPVPQLPADKSIKDLTVDAYTGVSNMLRSIMKTGRAEKSIQVGEKHEDFDSEIARGVEYLNRYSKTITKAEQTQPTFLQKLDRTRRFVDSWLVRLEQLMRDFGDKDLASPYFQIVSRPLEAAKGWSYDKRIELAKHFNALNKDMGPGFDAWLKQKLPTEGNYPHTGLLTKEGDPVFNFNRDIVSAALHMGDSVALQKFAEGWGTSPDHIEAIVHSMATDQMWKFVEGVWQSFEKLRPDIEAMYQRLTDVTPDMVEPRSFTIPEGGAAKPRKVQGGYFPVIYDPARMPKEWIQQLDPEAMLGDHQYVRATPSNGYIKSRTGVSAPIRMDLNGIHNRLNQVIHDLAYREALLDINRYMMHPDITSAIGRKYGPEYVGKIKRNLERIARAESTDTNENAAVSKAVDWLTEGQMINMIGFSPTTVMKHGTTAVTQGLAEVGPKYIAEATADYLRNPNQVGKAAAEESPEIRHIISTYGEDSWRQFLELTESTNPLQRYKRLAFHTIGFVNKQVAIAVYNGGKEMLRDKNPDATEETIQAGANQLVRQALGSSGVTDAPDALSAGKGVPGRFYRLQNNFLTFLSHMYNKSREIPQNLGYAGQKVDLGRAVALLISSVIVPVIIDQAVAKHGFAAVKSVGGFVGTLAEGVLHQFTAPVPGLNTVVAAGMHVATHGEYRQEESPTASLGEMLGTNIKDVTKLIQKHTWDNSATRHTILTAGQLGHLPGLELQRLEGFFHEMAVGKEQQKTVGKQVEDFIYGPKNSKASSGGPRGY